MITLKIDTYLCEFPEKIEEIAQPIFSKIAQLLYREKNTYSLKKQAFCLISKTPKTIIKKINAAQWVDLFKLLDFMFDITQVNYIQHFSIENEIFYFPEKGMEFSSVIEYAMAEESMRRLFEGDDTAIADLVFTICRPKDNHIDQKSPEWNGDIRERYSSALVSNRKKLKIPEMIQFFAVLFFLGCKKEISERYPEIFKKEKENQEEIKQEPSIFSWLKLIKAVAETGLYGNYEETCHTNFHTFCLNLCFDIEAQEKLKFSKNNDLQ